MRQPPSITVPVSVSVRYSAAADCRTGSRVANSTVSTPPTGTVPDSSSTLDSGR
jgi:hypothetical protein